MDLNNKKFINLKKNNSNISSFNVNKKLKNDNKSIFPKNKFKNFFSYNRKYNKSKWNDFYSKNFYKRSLEKKSDLGNYGFFVQNLKLLFKNKNYKIKLFNFLRKCKEIERKKLNLIERLRLEKKRKKRKQGSLYKGSQIYLSVKYTRNNMYIYTYNYNKIKRHYMVLSLGSVGFKGPSKKSDVAIKTLVYRFIGKLLDNGITNVIFILKVSFDWKIKILFKLFRKINKYVKITHLYVKPKIAHNGGRLKSKRRV